jgi:hypothetical protein
MRFSAYHAMARLILIGGFPLRDAYLRSKAFGEYSGSVRDDTFGLEFEEDQSPPASVKPPGKGLASNLRIAATVDEITAAGGPAVGGPAAGGPAVGGPAAGGDGGGAVPLVKYLHRFILRWCL